MRYLTRYAQTLHLEEKELQSFVNPTSTTERV